MINPKILVTGATGRTGGTVVTELLAKGWSVRVAVRVHDARSDLLQRRGVEIVALSQWLHRGRYTELSGQRGATKVLATPSTMNSLPLFAQCPDEFCCLWHRDPDLHLASAPNGASRASAYRINGSPYLPVYRA